MGFISSITKPLGNLIGDITGSNQAAEYQLQAADKSAGVTKYMYDTSRKDMLPWLTAGKDALDTYQNVMKGDLSSFYKDPGYQFELDEILGAVDRSAASRGKLYSGQTLKEIMRYGSGVARTGFGSYMNRLASLAGMGQTQAAQMGNLGMNQANQLSNIYQSAGNARAASAIAPFNTLMSAGGTAAGLKFAFSDKRLKKNIKYLGNKDGTPWYSFEYIWGERSEGTMSEDVKHIPGAVVKHPSGYDMVDYSKVKTCH